MVHTQHALGNIVERKWNQMITISYFDDRGNESFYVIDANVRVPVGMVPDHLAGPCKTRAQADRARVALSGLCG